MSGWTDERIDRLKMLWASGLSASEIARDLGGVTRNAVLGKAHRMNLATRADPSMPRRITLPTPKAPKPKSEPRPREPEVAFARGSWGCLWIEADENLGAAPKCGKPRIHKNGKDSSYCAKHHALCFISPRKTYELSDAVRAASRARLKRNLSKWNAASPR